MPIRIEARAPHRWAVAASIAIMVLAIIGHLTRIPYVSQHEFWFAAIGYLVLLVAVLY
jgi:ABC-type phosphate transport system auxiliary subunit